MTDLTLNINELVKQPEEFEKVKTDLKNLILSDFKVRHDKCTIVVSDGEEEITKGQALLNLFLLSLYKGCGIVITKDDLLLSDSISGDDIEHYLNKVLSRIKVDGKDYEAYRLAVFEFLNEASDLSAETNVIAGNTLDFLDFVDAEIEDPEAKDLFSANIPYGLQFSEIEDIFNKKGKDIITYFNNHKDRNLSPFTRSKTGINVKQMTQTLSMVGLKPGFDGKVIPKCVTGNFLHGLTNIEDYFISAKGARLALSTNYKMVRVSGYLTRKLSLLMIDTWHDVSIEDCGSKHYVEYKIDTDKKLKMIDGRNYYDLINGKADYDNLKTIDVNDKSLIGKTIALRSPVTCLGNHPGGHICKTCYGKALAEINKNLNTGLVSVLLLTNILTQRLLSAKHLLATNTDKVEWGDDFDDAFTVNMDSIYFSDDTKTELTIKYPTDDDYDEDTDSYALSEFEIKFVDDKKTVNFVSPTPLYIKAINVPKHKQDEETFKISSETFGSSEDVFKYIPHNNMLSKSLQNILDLIESSNHLGITTYDELVNTFADLLIENGMDSINSVHAEMIASRLLTDDATGDPIDWSEEVIKPYTINRVSKMVLKSPISTSLSFERLGDQLSNIETYLKDDDSIMDSLFN